MIGHEIADLDRQLREGNSADGESSAAVCISSVDGIVCLSNQPS